MSENSDFSDAALVGGRLQHNSRRARIAWLDDGGSAGWVMARIVAAVARANREHFSFDLSDFRERLQVAAYDGGEEGYFDWHSDVGDGPMARFRKLTIVAQLSDPATYDGGTLSLNPGGSPLAVSAGQGDAAIFASFVLHKVSPVMKGRRYSLTCWVHGPSLR